ncbi:MAG: STAS domain-containing protein [Nitrososphaera sp.]
MLRITETSVDEKTVTLRLDGKVISTTLSDLEKLCLHYRDRENKTVLLDFSGVTFMNNAGVKMLKRIKDERIKIVKASLFIETLLRIEGINNGNS